MNEYCGDASIFLFEGSSLWWMGLFQFFLIIQIYSYKTPYIRKQGTAPTYNHTQYREDGERTTRRPARATCAIWSLVHCPFAQFVSVWTPPQFIWTYPCTSNIVYSERVEKGRNNPLAVTRPPSYLASGLMVVWSPCLIYLQLLGQNAFFC